MAMTLVETVTVGSGGAASIEFTNIPQTGKDLLLKLSGRNTGGGYVAVYTLNSDTTAANYVGKDLEGSGSGVTTGNYTSGANGPILIDTSSDTANTFGNGELYISNYTSSTNKSISTDSVNENNATAAYQRLMALRYSTSSSISTLKLEAASGNFAQYSTASLYIIS